MLPKLEVQLVITIISGLAFKSILFSFLKSHLGDFLLAVVSIVMEFDYYQ